MSRRALNVLELWPTVGYLHEFIGCQTKQSLVYDLQEPFRWLADIAVMEAFESGLLDLPDFYFTGDDYRYRFEPEAKERFLDLLRERFNSVVRYRGRALKWDTVIERKTVELDRYLAPASLWVDGSSCLVTGRPPPWGGYTVNLASGVSYVSHALRPESSRNKADMRRGTTTSST